MTNSLKHMGINTSCLSKLIEQIVIQQNTKRWWCTYVLNIPCQAWVFISVSGEQLFY